MSKLNRKLVDLCLFAIIVLLLITAFTRRIAIHEVIGLLFILMIVVHLAANLKWVKNTLQNLWRGRANSKSKYMFGLAVVLFFFFGLAIITGLLTAQNQLGPNISVVHRLHAVSAIISILLAVVHVKLNWPYLKKLFFKPLQ